MGKDQGEEEEEEEEIHITHEGLLGCGLCRQHGACHSAQGS
jgi:hypothetical protein